MSEKTLFVITENSEMERWDITRNKLDINSAMLTGLTASLTRTIRGVVPMNIIDPINKPTGFMDLAIGPNGYCAARMPVASLPLTAPYAVEGTTVYPVFDGAHPITALRWNIPANMRLYLVAHIGNTMECVEQFLVAIDDEKRCWRLPVSNLYADCRLCAGRFNSAGSDILDVCKRTWEQFQLSSWNQDLYGDSSAARRIGTKVLFLYDVKDDNFIQRQPPKKWMEMCEKVATDFLTGYVNY
jgi:hypothetical protein